MSQAPDRVAEPEVAASEVALPSAPPPLLRALAARPIVDGLHSDAPFDAVCVGPLLLIVGASPALRALLFGVAAVAETAPARRPVGLSGELSLAGLSALDGRHAQRFGLASYGAALPGAMQLRDYLGWGARLRGAGRGQAAALADAALEKWQLRAQAKRRLGQLSAIEQRAVSLAYASVTRPAGLILDRPLDDLAAEPAAFLGALIDDVSGGRDLIVLLSALSATGPYAALSQRASDVLLFRDGRLLCQQSGAALWQSPRLFDVQVLGEPQALCDALRAAGAELAGSGPSLIVSLPVGGDIHTVLSAAAATETALTRCAPLLGAGPMPASAPLPNSPADRPIRDM